MSPNQKPFLNSKILRWYRSNGRDLPWRNERDPYRVLVSEVMLQQTQVSRVLTKYPRFLRQFPTLQRLAHARTSDVIKAWEGMGYNNRGLRLQRLAVTVLKEHQGKIPRSIQVLEELPGIGRYTAHALASFSFGQHVPVVDTNIRRMLTRFCFPKHRTRPPKEEDIWILGESLLPRGDSHNWNQALMDFGATVCTAARPKCIECPVAQRCPSAHRIRRKKPGGVKTEPGRDGIPNRIYRGRAVQVLREMKREEISPSLLARKIKPNFNPQDRRWFESLLRGLQRDGLIHFHSGKRVSLPE